MLDTLRKVEEEGQEEIQDSLWGDFFVMSLLGEKGYEISRDTTTLSADTEAIECFNRLNSYKESICPEGDFMEFISAIRRFSWSLLSQPARWELKRQYKFEVPEIPHLEEGDYDCDIVYKLLKKMSKQLGTFSILNQVPERD